MTEHCCQVCVLVMMFCRPDCRLCAGMCGKSGTSVPRVLTNSRRFKNFTVQFGVLTSLTCWPVDTPAGQHGIWKIFFTFGFHILPKQRHIGARIIPCRWISIKKIVRVDSSSRARDTAAMWSITWDIVPIRGESATKTVKFFAAHTVNCAICNDHTIIDWMLLNFTQVIQQNCRQLGRKFEKSFCAVDRLSCQLELSKSKTSQFRSDLVFDIVNYVHVIFLHGG